MSYVASTAADNAAEIHLIPPPLSIAWHSLFWAEGTLFAAEGYSDGDAVSPWPNETGESDATEATNKPTYRSAYSPLNSQPAVEFDGSNDTLASANFTSNPTYDISIVTIMRQDAVGGYQFHIDGNDSSNRNAMGASNTGTWEHFAGTERKVGTADTSAHMFRGEFLGSTSNAKLFVDETQIDNGNIGSQTLDGVTLGSIQGGSSGNFDGGLAFVGIYEGDISSDGSWSKFKTWVTDHYGITLA